ncbi:MAG: hypothetical protein LC633_04170 [Desulfobulbaceae bacterium]|nr:hypothetical protein [Desulfobulbaceae bacterium]
MDIDISKVMTHEIRKEMAERYFGFRKLIEEDKEALAQAIRRQSLTIEQRVGIDLTRIYMILRDRRLIDRFLEISGLEEALFYDDYVIDSPTIRARIFAGIKTRGLTKSGRFTKLFLGRQGDEILAAPVQTGGAELLKSKMEVRPPGPVEHHLPALPPLVPMPRIRGELKKLAQQALKGHPDGFVVN